MDVVSPETRSYVMSRIRGRNTRPELALRAALSAMKVRGYRLHGNVPGRPDLVFTRTRVAVFVDGCFWHRCRKCAIPLPRSNRSYWLPKFARIAVRDRSANRRLRTMGWSVIHVWEHQISEDPFTCATKIARKVSARLNA
jgi:DNA mismatch endonuclease (patch repair protein)